VNLLDLARSALLDLPPALPRRVATASERSAIEELVSRLSEKEPERWTDADIREAIEVACNDPEDALISLRALVGEATKRDSDSRRTCSQCRNLTPGGQCMAAYRGEAIWASPRMGRKYFPVTNLPQMCWGYLPGPDDPDRRNGRERWPNLFRKYEAQ
jgi:hypothetical protein